MPGRGQLNPSARVEHDLAHGDPGACRNALPDRLALLRGGHSDPLNRVQVIAGQPVQRRLLIDQALVDQVAGNPQGRPRRPLGVARLEQEEAVLLHGELKILGVVEEDLQLLPDAA